MYHKIVKNFSINILFILRLKLRRSPFFLLLTLLILLFGIIPFRVAITLYQTPLPQAILVLGGNSDRMKFAAQFWQTHPSLEIWVSDYPRNFAVNSNIFQAGGVPEQKVHYDFCPTDTVTNFTCFIKQVARRNIRHLYLITSDYHMARSRVIAFLVLGSRGIIVTPLSVPSEDRKPESFIRIIRDFMRSLLWIVTGRTGASLNPDLNL